MAKVSVPSCMPQCALRIALMIHCKRNGLPHPGVLVLDTPLLAYRGPVTFERHGELADDERALKETELNRGFYSHVGGLDGFQVIVLENETPPDEAFRHGTVQVFTRKPGPDRYGFFPVLAGGS